MTVTVEKVESAEGTKVFLAWRTTSGTGRRTRRREFLWVIPAGLEQDKVADLEYRAICKAQAREAELANPAEQAAQGAMPLGEAITRHILWMRTANYSHSAQDMRQRVLDRLALAGAKARPPTQYVGQVTPAVIAAWRDERLQAVKGSTLTAEASHVQGFCDWGHERGLMPAKLTAMPKNVSRLLDTSTSDDRLRFVTTDRLGEILGEMNGRGRPICTVLAGTGLRKGELAELQAGWYDAPERVLTIPEYGTGRTKVHGRTLPVGPITGEIIQQARMANCDDGGDLIFVGELGGRLAYQANRWLRRFGISPHDLRRWYSQTLLSLRCPSEHRDALLGHKPSRTDRAYIQPALGELRKFVERLDALIPSASWPVPCAVSREDPAPPA